jgi:glycerol-3-phosphate acyltransferase PlsY
MLTVTALAVLAAGYLLGSIPFGLIVVKVTTGKDVRRVESGRTGGTNAMRAAGLWAGLSTAFLDILKGACSVWIARWLAPGATWLEIISPFFAIIGHNYSLYLIERGSDGRLRFRGGAGGAPAVGGAFGLWWPSIFIMVPLGAAVLYFIGYASLTTLSVGIAAALVFAIRALSGASPWEYILYGLLAEVALIWALRPNIKRLLTGTERLVGWRAKRQREKMTDNPPDQGLTD